MKNAILGAICVAGLASFLATECSAAPPEDCAIRFVGSWVGTSNGDSNKYYLTANPDGALGCVPAPMSRPCAAEFHWSCNGDTFFQIGPTRTIWKATLSKDGKSITGPDGPGLRYITTWVRAQMPLDATSDHK